MYRDEIDPIHERVGRLRAQLDRARKRPPDDIAVASQRQRRELARVRRKVWRLRHPILRLLPASLSELGAVLGYWAAAMFMAAAVWLVLASPYLALTTMRGREPLTPAVPLSIADAEMYRHAALEALMRLTPSP